VFSFLKVGGGSQACQQKLAQSARVALNGGDMSILGKDATSLSVAMIEATTSGKRGEGSMLADDAPRLVWQ